MEYYRLPKTDLEVSKIALGCMRIASKTEEEVDQLVHVALEQGINFFDHADIYGAGKSEELFGQVLAKQPSLRDKMVIQTKCAIRPGICYDFSRDYIISCVEDSLRRLQTDYVDVLLLHRPDALCDPKEVADTFDELHKSGKVKYFGVSNHTPLQMELLQKYSQYPLVANQLQLSIVHSVMVDSGLNMNMTGEYAVDRDGGVLDYCRLHDIMIQAWSVVQASWEDGTFINHPKYAKLNEEMEVLCEKYHTNKNAIALAWILRHPAGIQPILGTTSPVHLKESLEALDFRLTREEWYKLYLSAGKPLP